MNAAAAARRIVVAVDRSEAARAAVEAAAELARGLRAELLALFVEDVELVRVAQFPFVHEIGVDAQVREFDEARLERHFRSEGRQAREASERAAVRCSVNLRFAVVRGSVPREILAAAEGAEMVVVGRAGLPAPRGFGPRGEAAMRLGRTAQALISSGARTVAVIGSSDAIGTPLAVVHDGSEGSARALDLAIRLAGEDHLDLAVLLACDPSRFEEVSAEVSAAAAAAGLEPRVAETGAGAAAIAARVHDLGCRAVVVDRSCTALGEGGAVALVEGLDCPVFVTG